MRTRWLCLLVLPALLVMAGCQEGQNTDKQALSVDSTSLAGTQTQLKINQQALFRGATEDIRVDAAMIMLLSDNPRDRQVLIDALKQSEPSEKFFPLDKSENRQACIAVCKALSASREARYVIKDKNDFIEPLAGILRTDDTAAAKFAAQAALLFDYDEIAGVFEPMAKDPAMPVNARLNAIYALKVQLDTRAITLLVELVEDKNPQVSSAAGDALRSIGIPVGQDPRSRAQIIAELRTRGMERFQRQWLVRQEARVSELEKERDLWKKSYLGALDKIYEGLVDEGQRGKLLTEYLGSSEETVRLWALDKVLQWRMGTQAKLPVELGPVLVKLISDDDRNVRLAAAKLLSLSGELSDASRLAAQFGVEQDEEVKLELFFALGAACQYALVPTSGVQLSPELRRQTLDWAVAYLNSDDAKKTHRGAEVIRKLLEPGGLESDEVAKYLDLLVARYKKAQQSQDMALKGELLGTMARLCGQNAYKSESAKRFSELFEKAIEEDTDLVREVAVDGLICVDKSKALKILAKDYVNDRSQLVRNRVMELAGEVGGKDDLTWLWDKVGANADSKPAWQAMLKIFNGSDVNVGESWFNKVDSLAGREKLADEQRITFFEMEERKAIADNRNTVVRSAREKLAQLYGKTGQFEQAAEYLGKLRESAETAEQKEVVLGQLLDVYLRWPKVDAAAWLVGNCLLEKDLSSDSAIIRTVDSFCDNPSGGADPNIIMEAFRKIKPAERRPMWEQHLARWNKRFGSAGQQNGPQVKGG